MFSLSYKWASLFDFAVESRGILEKIFESMKKDRDIGSRSIIVTEARRLLPSVTNTHHRTNENTRHDRKPF